MSCSQCRTSSAPVSQQVCKFTSKPPRSGTAGSEHSPNVQRLARGLVLSDGSSVCLLHGVRRSEATFPASPPRGASLPCWALHAVQENFSKHATVPTGQRLPPAIWEHALEPGSAVDGARGKHLPGQEGAASEDRNMTKVVIL